MGTGRVRSLIGARLLEAWDWVSSSSAKSLKASMSMFLFVNGVNNVFFYSTLGSLKWNMCKYIKWEEQSFAKNPSHLRGVAKSRGGHQINCQRYGIPEEAVYEKSFPCSLG